MKEYGHHYDFNIRVLYYEEPTPKLKEGMTSDVILWNVITLYYHEYFEELEEKLKTSKPTITGKEVKIDKDTYDTLNSFMNTSKRVIKDMPNNQALFKDLTDYTKGYKDLENEKRNIQVEVRKLRISKRKTKRRK